MIAVIADVEIRNNLFNIFDFVNTLADNLTTVRLEIYCVIFFQHTTHQFITHSELTKITMQGQSCEHFIFESLQRD